MNNKSFYDFSLSELNYLIGLVQDNIQSNQSTTNFDMRQLIALKDKLYLKYAASSTFKSKPLQTAYATKQRDIFKTKF